MAEWQKLINEKRASNLEKIPKDWRLSSDLLSKIQSDSNANVLSVPGSCGILTPKELEITEAADATTLLQKLAKGELSAYEVTLAFCKRAAIAQQLVNCLTEIFFEQALERAKELDGYFKEKGKVMGVLHGLPISLKDSFNVKGVTTTIGYVSYLKNPPSQINSGTVEILLSHGAIPYVKTNLPQTMMSADSENHIFGRTLNPNKLNLTAGGSTGGEGALIKLRGSILGVGTDIAGSIRIPALCNGIFGFKPTAGRVPFTGKVPPGRLIAPSQIPACIGPEGHSVRDLDMWMQTVVSSGTWLYDEGCVNVPWRNVEAPTRKLRLGYLTEAKSRRLPLHPTVVRTMVEARKSLEGAGHAIVDMDDLLRTDLYDLGLLAWKYFSLDPQKTPFKIIASGGEEPVKSLATTQFPELKDWTASLDELFDMNLQRRQTLKVFHDILIENELDAFIMPTYQATAVSHDLYGRVIYSVLPNLLDYPAAQIPFLKADKALDKAYVRGDVTYSPPYDADAVEGAPSGLQLVGPPMRDEELLKYTAIVSDVLKANT